LILNSFMMLSDQNKPMPLNKLLAM